MTVVQKRPWRIVTCCDGLMLLSTGVVGYPLLADNHGVNTAYQAMQVEEGGIETFLSPRQVVYHLCRYVFDRLSLIGGHMGRAIPALQMITTLFQGAGLPLFGGTSRKKGGERRC